MSWKARAFILAVATLLGACSKGPQPLRIGVLLPLSGDSAVGFREPLEFAVANINAHGGPAGRPLELVYCDLAAGEPITMAEQFLDDDSIVAVLGPDTSGGLFDLAKSFINRQKLLLSPSATSGDIFRAFGGSRFLWRTVESDIAQMQSMLLTGTAGGAKKVALIAAADTYGTTFFDWFGFFATELGLEASAVVRYDETDPLCEPFVAQALAAQPEVLFLGASKPDAVVCIARQARTLSPTTRLFFSDSAYFPALITKLGTLAEGLEGTVPSPDPGSGFETAYRVHFGHPPPPYAANLYDALTLLAYSLERSNGEGGERLADALVDVVDARGPATGWDRQGIGEALTGIKNGHLPDVQGASGPLDFDPDLHTEPVASVYGHWRIEYGDFVTLAFISTGASKRATSLSRSFASHKRSQKLDSNSSYNPGPKAKTWALIAALSGGWQNYRHQADALAHYQALRANGIPDDHLVLVLADDLATNSQSAEPGMVRNVAGGPNLYAEVEIDYSLEELTADDLLAILAGKSSPELPVVIDSSADDNVYVFLVGHGNSSGVLVGGSRAGMEQGAGETLLLPEQLAATAASMFAHKRYRRLLIAVEACHGGILGTQLESPGVLLLAGANPTESSLGSNYDPDFDLWRADQFAYQLYLANTTTPTLALDELYQQLYLQVGGSHVTAYNANNFSGISTVTLQEFVQ